MRYRGHLFTDGEGRYRFRTILPALYPGRTRHYHIKVQAPERPVLGAFEAFVTFARLHGVTLGAGKMAKTKKTARELAAMVMREVRASGKCSDLQNVVVHPTGRNYPTWECATQVNKPDNPNYQLSAACRHTLDLIVGRLQSIYDLAG